LNVNFTSATENVCSSLNVFDDGAVLRSIFLDFLHRPYVFQPQCFEGWLFPRHQVNLLWWVQLIELASIGRLQ
jgi:hypothetical protein